MGRLRYVLLAKTVSRSLLYGHLKHYTVFKVELEYYKDEYR
jgi:hypothetical protein